MKRTFFFNILLMFALTLAAGAEEFLIEDFETLGGLHVWGEYYDTTLSKVEIVSEPVKAGSGAAKVSYALRPVGDSLAYVQLAINKLLPANYGAIKLWVYGNEKGNLVYMRIVDGTGETFQYRLGNLTPGWQLLEVDLANPIGSWGGDEDRLLDGPVRVDSIIVDKPPVTDDVVYFDQLMFSAEGGFIRGCALDPNGYPVEGIRVSLAEDPFWVTETDENGEYELFCPAGTYTLTAEKKGYESQQIPNVTVTLAQTTRQDWNVMWGPDTSVYSDKAYGSEDGLILQKGGGEKWNGEIVEIGGRKAVKTNNASGIRYFCYDVDNSYLYGGNNRVWIFVEYYDQGNGVIGLQYDSQTGGFTLAGVVTRTNTLTWKTASFFLPDARFVGGTAGGDFWFGIWVPGYGFQPDAYIGKVTVMKEGRVLQLSANPKVFSPAKGKTVEVFYKLSAAAAVSAWVEDRAGSRIATLAEGQEQTLQGTVTWAGRTDQGELVPDGVYVIKLGTVGQGWNENGTALTTVEVDNSSPAAPRITEPASPVTLNEPRLFITGLASTGANVAVYLGEIKAGQARADGKGKITYLLQNLTVGNNLVTLREVDPAGNESEHSGSLAVNYAPDAAIGQLTVWPQEFNPRLNAAEVRFYLAGQQNVELNLLDGEGNVLAQLLPLASRSGEVRYQWDGKIDGAFAADGIYLLKVQGAAQAVCKVAVDSKPPLAPVLLLPSFQVSDGLVRFAWEGDGSASQYRLAVWQEGREEEKQVYDALQASLQLTEPLRSGEWFWQVESRDEAGNCASSEQGSFTVNKVLPATLEILNLQAGPNPFAPNGNGRYEQLQVSYSLTQPATVQIKIFNLAGKEVYRRSSFPEAAGDHFFLWDGRDGQGRRVAGGADLLAITADSPERKAPSRARKLISVLY